MEWWQQGGRFWRGKVRAIRRGRLFGSLPEPGSLKETEVFSAGAASRSASDAFGGGMRDYSDDLIDLIERTIAPESWETNGGSTFIMNEVMVLQKR